MKIHPDDRKCVNWADYWSQDEFWRDSPLGEINARLFFRRAGSIIEFKKNDRVLDIGCGPGHSEKCISPFVRSIHAVDVAEQFVDMCAARCRDCGNVSAGRLKADDYTDLDSCPGPFSVIICVSVVQYYRDVGEIEALIASVKKRASPGARMLIADLPVERGMLGFIWDAFCSYMLSVRHGYARILVRTALTRWFRGTRYKAFYDKAEQLYFTKRKLESLIGRLKLNARIIRGDFSVYANRLSLLIQF